jgi:hypothetical protein
VRGLGVRGLRVGEVGRGLSVVLPRLPLAVARRR